MPAYLASPLQKMVSIKPHFRQSSLIGSPALTCLLNPMLCSYGYLLFLMPIILRVDGLLGKITGTAYEGQVSRIRS